MAQKYKVFIDDKSLIIIDEKKFQQNSTNGITYNSLEKFAANHDIYKLNENVVVVARDPEQTFQALKDKFIFIKAAGGIVEHNGKYLFIKRLGKWDLPKGKIDAREKTKKAALREIEEECSVKNHTISYKICNTYHTYPLKGKHVLKKTSWYHFTVLDLTNQELKPQTEEDITELRWFSWAELDEVRSNTYQSILDVLDEFAANQNLND